MIYEIQKAADVLLKGGLLLYPTDTIWGIGCDALNEHAIHKIFQLKQRADHKNLIILIAEAKEVFKYTAVPPPNIIELIESFARPTTVIYEQALGLPDKLVGADGTIGIRVTRDIFCKRLIKKLNRPLVSTSANISGSLSPKGFDDIQGDIKEAVDYVVNYRREDIATQTASKIIKLFSDGRQEVIRD